MAVEDGRAPHVEAHVEEGYLRGIVERLTAIGSTPLGFRVAGTPEDLRAAELFADELRALDLDGVRLEPVPVDAWRFGGSSLVTEDAAFECASFGGAPATPPGGIEADVVDAGRGTRRDLAGRDVVGKILLVDWRGDQLLWPSLLAAEAARAGAAAIVVACLEGGRYYQAERALGSFDALWLPGAVPLATIRSEDLLRLRDRARTGAVHARLTVDVDLARGGTGWNVVGTLPGRTDGPPVFVAGHHDAWFRGAIDDATGVAATLAIAKAMRESGHEPERPVVFGSHTAEEYGITDSPFDWLLGAWWQVAHQHPEWNESLALYVNIEGTGFPLALQVDAPPELRRFSRHVCRGARRDGLLPHGVVYGEPRSATELWAFLVAGIPGVSVQTAAPRYIVERYHTPFDDVDHVDFANLAVMTRVFARFAVAADRAPAALLAPIARVEDIRRRGRLRSAADAGARVARLEAALARYEAAARGSSAAARRAFALLAPALEALNARDKESRLHLQALTDVRALDDALAALEAGDVRGAARAAARCGRNRLARDLSRDVFRADAARHRPEHPRLAWGARANLTHSPDLWDELAALADGDPSVGRSLREKRAAAADELQKRLDRTADALDAAAAALE